MTQHPPPADSEPDVPAPFDVVAATNALFEEIAKATGNPGLKDMMVRVNVHLAPLRSLETVYIADLKSEYDALSDAWTRRDLPCLNALLSAYFQRRRELAQQISHQTNHLN